MVSTKAATISVTPKLTTPIMACNEFIPGPLLGLELEPVEGTSVVST